MLADTNERPGVEEQYQTANNASDLRVEADRRGAADVLIAAGYSQSRLGMALLRLHSEWDTANRRLEREAAKLPTVAEFAARMAPVALRVERDAHGRPRTVRGPNMKCAAERAHHAKHEADRSRESELRMLANDLKSRATVWAELAPWLKLKGIGHEIGAAALQHWLSPTCPHCQGHGLRKVPNQPALSAKQCNRCHGTGRRPAPKDSGRVLGHLDYCVGVARGSLKNRLRRS